MKMLQIPTTFLLLAIGSQVALAQDKAPSETEILADLRQNSLSAEEILGVESLESITFISLDGFAAGKLQRLEDTLRGTEDGFGEVQTAFERNEVLESKIRDKDIPLRDIVAVTRSQGAGLAVYFDMPRL